MCPLQGMARPVGTPRRSAAETGWSSSMATGAADPADTARLIDALGQGADLAIGRAQRTWTPVPWALAQRHGNTLACALMRLLWRMPAHDLGPHRAIRRTALESLDMRDRSFGWTVEMQVRAHRLGLRRDGATGPLARACRRHFKDQRHLARCVRRRVRHPRNDCPSLGGVNVTAPAWLRVTRTLPPTHSKGTHDSPSPVACCCQRHPGIRRRPGPRVGQRWRRQRRNRRYRRLQQRQGCLRSEVRLQQLPAGGARAWMPASPAHC